MVTWCVVMQTYVMQRLDCLISQQSYAAYLAMACVGRGSSGIETQLMCPSDRLVQVVSTGNKY